MNPQKKLEKSILKNDLKGVKKALSRGADPNRCDSEYVLPLYRACKLSDMKIAIALLEEGCNIDALDDFSATVFWRMCHEGNLKACEFLLDAGADPNIRDEDNQGPFEMACWKGHADIIRLFLEKVPGILQEKAKWPYKWPYLHTACCSGNPEAVRLLLSAGEDINTVDEVGFSLLHVTASGWSKECFTPDMVRFLFQNGIDPGLQAKTTRGKDGTTAVDFLFDAEAVCSKEQRLQIFDVFREYVPGMLLEKAISLPDNSELKKETIDWFQENQPELYFSTWCQTPAGQGI